MRIRTGDFTTHCRVAGPEGAPWVTLAHSIAATSALWEAQMAALSPRFRVLAYDIRGHGESEAPPPPYTFGQLAGDVVALWDALGIARSHVVGLSLGGMIAAGLALDHADRILSAVIANSMMAATPPFVESWNARIALARDKGVEAVIEPTLARWFRPDFMAENPGTIARVKEMIRACSTDGFIGAAEALKGLDYRRRLSGIRLSCLFIAGREDIACPAAGIKDEAALVPGAEYAELSPAAHISNIEQPAAFNRALLGFFDRHS